MSSSHIAAGQIVSDPQLSAAPASSPSPSLADLPTDVLAELGARLGVVDVGTLLLVSTGVRDCVRSNEPLWAAQYAMRWVRMVLK